MAWQEAMLELIEFMRGEFETEAPVPDYPQAGAHGRPTIFLYSTEGTTTGAPMGAMTMLDVVTIAIFEPYVDLESQTERLLPYRESIPAALLRKNISREWEYLNTFGAIEHTYGQFEWGGQQMIGYLFSLREVKVQVVL